MKVITILFFSIFNFFVSAQTTYFKEFSNPSGWTLSVSCQSVNSINEQYIISNSYSGTYHQRIIWKLSSDGQELWSKEPYDLQLGDVFIKKCYATNDGGVLVLGYSLQNLIFKLDSNGTLEWSRKLSSATNLKNLTVDSEGNIYLTGGECNTGSIAAIKLNSIGDYIWHRSYHNVGTGSGLSIRESQDGNILICGIIENDSRAAILKIDPNGILIFGEIFDNQQYLNNIRPVDFSEFDSGKILIVGEANEDLPNTKPEAFVILCDSQGNLIDSKLIDAPNYIDLAMYCNTVSSTQISSQSNELVIGMKFFNTGSSKTVFVKIDDQLNLISNESIDGNGGNDVYLDLAPNGDVYSLSSHSLNVISIRHSVLLNSYCIENSEDLTMISFPLIQSQISQSYNLTLSVSPAPLNLVNFDMNEYTICQSNLSTEAIIDDKQMRVYPNPTHNSLHVDWDSKEKGYFELMDLKGNLVLSFSISENGSKIINISKLNKGIYILNTISNEMVRSDKIVVY